MSCCVAGGPAADSDAADKIRRVALEAVQREKLSEMQSALDKLHDLPVIDRGGLETLSIKCAPMLDVDNLDSASPSQLQSQFFMPCTWPHVTDCQSEDCQKRIMDIADSKNIAIYNIFAEGVEEAGSTENYALAQEDTQQGFTSQACLWYPEDDFEIVYIGDEVYDGRQARLASLPVGGEKSTITITPNPVTTDKAEFSNVRVLGTESDGVVLQARTSIPLGNGTVLLPYKDKGGKMTSTERIFVFPPWPEYTTWPLEVHHSDKVTSNPAQSFKTHEPTLPIEPADPKFTPTPTPTETSIENPNLTEFQSHCTETECEGEKDDDDRGAFIFFRVRCDDLWFFNFCIDTNNHKIKGWKFRLRQSSKFGPGPPPIVIDYPTQIIYPPILPP
ncbi:exo-beta-1,3-glucanase [Cordyceps fumosorosea ARSEF 2679]|uniref:Exo-beta-1,3-glucanase n=1 Tax=Cordyceps fumosorosea (strain ARSEF 2679) TaxID=1081104 RepID=A0A167BDW0_CORFA|nr:exo-beta-1,3-glucanase [Cordyceps fumosorosea ARSEF 2679]OAA39934.1 exo-beta-1,3-glucanase [Cordyceps fumosorosea ARSEF 2679]